LRILIIAVGLLLVPMPAWAEQWKQGVSVHQSVGYDSNPDLAPSGEKGIWRGRLSPSYALTWSDGLSEWVGSASLLLERSSDRDRSQDRKDPSASLGWKRFTEFGEVSLQASYDEASTRVTELEESGLVVADGTRERTRFVGGWRRSLSAYTDMAWTADYTDVEYDGGSLVDYRAVSLGVTLDTALSPRTGGFVSLSTSRHDPDDDTDTSSLHSLMLGLRWNSSARALWSVQGGIASTDGEDDGVSGQGAISLAYDTERGAINLQAGRSVTSSGLGGYAEADYARAALSYALDETRSIGADVSWRRVDDRASNTLRQFGLWANQELTPRWSARLSYFAKQRDSHGLGEATAHVVELALRFSHPSF